MAAGCDGECVRVMNAEINLCFKVRTSGGVLRKRVYGSGGVLSEGCADFTCQQYVCVTDDQSFEYWFPYVVRMSPHRTLWP